MKITDKLLRSIPGVIALIIMSSILIWGYNKMVKCDENLKKNGQVIMMFCEYSKEKRSGNGGIDINTLFKTYYNGIEIRATCHHYIRPVPKGMPIYVLYSFDEEDCYEVIFDSIIEYQNYRFENKYTKNKGYDYIISKLE